MMGKGVGGMDDWVSEGLDGKMEKKGWVGKQPGRQTATQQAKVAKKKIIVISIS